MSQFPARAFLSMLQWAELTLLLVTQRLADSLAKRGSQEVNGSDEATRSTFMELRSRSTEMASELLELDPIHARLYTFLRHGGTLWPSPDGMRIHQFPAAEDGQVMQKVDIGWNEVGAPGECTRD